MKSKYLFFAMAASLAFASCTNEEFGYDENAVPKGDMISVDELNMVFVKGDAQTRALWDEQKDGLKFFWTSAEDAIGMVYTGNGGTAGITNYRFTTDSLKLASFKKKDGQTRWTGFYGVEETLDNVKSAYTKENGDDLVQGDLDKSTSAKFKTVNDEILKGYYVAYYPHDKDYKNAGELIPVKSPKEINVTDQKSNLQAVGESTFSYSTPAEVKAGKQVTEFALKNLSSALRIRIANEGALGEKKELKSVVLRARGNDAFVVKGKLSNPSAQPSADVINVDATEGKSATLFVRYDENSYLNIEANQTTPTPGTKGDTVDVYFPVLPAAFASDGFDVILIGTDNKACVLDAKFKAAGVTLPAGKRISLNTKLTKDTKFDQAFVTTADELQTAINNAKNQTAPTTINLLGDIESSNFNMSGIQENDWKGGVTIVASTGSKLTLNTPTINIYNATDATKKDAWLTINAPLTIKGGSILGNVALKAETTIAGELTIGSANSAADYYSGQLSIGGKTTILPGATVTARYSKGVTVEKGAELIIAKSTEEGVDDGKFVNDNWKYGDVQYKSDLIIEGTMTVDGVLEDGGDTQINGGKLIVNGTVTNRNTLNATNGTIEVNGKFFNELALGSDVSNKLGNVGNVKIATGTLTINEEGEIYNKSSLNCMGTFVNNGTFYDYVGSVYGGVPYTSNGAYACYVNSAERLAEAYNRLNIYANGKFQKIILQELSDNATYTLDNKSAANVNFENEGDVIISKGTLINSLKVNAGTVTISGDMKISGAAINGQQVDPLTIVKGGTATFNNNIEVKANGAIINTGTFNLLNAQTATDLPANVYCTSADVTKGTWTNYPLVIKDGSFWE